MVTFTRALSVLCAVLFLSVGCCNAQALCSGTYNVAYLNTVQSQSGGPLGIFKLPTNYTNAYINFCAQATGCPAGARACLTGPDVATVTLCSGQPTVVGYIDSSAPTLGIKFSCSVSGSPPLNGIISCGPQASVSGFDALYTSVSPGPGGAVAYYDFAVPSMVYCTGVMIP